MQQRKSILAASGITAFLLVLVAGLMLFTEQAAPAQGALPPYETELPGAISFPVEAATPESIGPSLQELVAEREASYRQQLDEANARLQEANRRLQQLYVATPTPLPLETPTPLPQPTAEASPTRYPVSVEDAVRNALDAEPGATLLRTPELVSFNGVAAYEVPLRPGNVYVDANTGSVLYSEVQTSGISSSPQPPVQRGGGEDDEEREDDD